MSQNAVVDVLVEKITLLEAQLAESRKLKEAFDLLRRWREAAGELYIEALLGPSVSGEYKCRLWWISKHVAPLYSLGSCPLQTVRDAISYTPWKEV